MDLQMPSKADMKAWSERQATRLKAAAEAIGITGAPMVETGGYSGIYTGGYSASQTAMLFLIRNIVSGQLIFYGLGTVRLFGVF